MEKTEILKSVNVVSDDLINMVAWLKTDRFNNGLKNLEYLIQWSLLVEKFKKAFKRNEWKVNLTSITGIDYDTVFNKNDSGAIGKIAKLDHKALKAWYVKENKFMVSPRSILQAFTAKPESKEKTELEKILQTLKTLDTQAQNYELTELEIANVKSDLKAVTTIINKMVANDTTEKKAA